MKELTVPDKVTDNLFDKGDRLLVFGQGSTVLSSTQNSAVLRLDDPIVLSGEPNLIVHKMLDRMTIVVRRVE